MNSQLGKASGRALGWMLGIAVMLSGSSVIAAGPGPKDILEFKPKQKDVEYETPKPEDVAKCKVEAERKGKGAGWLLLGPSGQVLRRFMDSDGDGKLDQWRYYDHGIEVYRDLDTNANDVVDQSRWLNLGGTRWGVDKNEDGRIDFWKVISAAETSKEAIRAMAAGDDPALQTLMVTADDLKSIGLNQDLAAKLLESAADAGKKGRAIMSKSKVLTPQTRWARFDAQMPSTIPQDEEKATGDLSVYENAMVIVELQGKFAGVQIGEMVRIGEAWKLTQVPQPLEEGTTVSAGGILMQPLLPSTTGPAPTNNPEVEKILLELQKLEQLVMQPNTDRAKTRQLMSRRAELMRQAIDLAATDQEKLLLSKQMIDGLALAAQIGNYPEGVSDLKAIEMDARKKGSKSPLIAYVVYRRIQAQYYVDSQSAEKEKEKAAEVQKAWIQNMDEFIKEFPDSEDAPDAMLLMANHEELSANLKAASDWYQRLIREKPKTDAATRATGAMRRLDLKGKPLTLSGPGLDGKPIDIRSFRGKTVLVVFWASDFPVCEEDLPQLRALYDAYRSKGFEILGVCLDNEQDRIKPYLTQHKMSWPQICHPGGLTSSPPALNFGIISLPTMFLVNSSGEVVDQSATIQEVKTSLPALLLGK